MLLVGKLKIFSAVAFVGVVLIVVSYISPGWVILSYQNTQEYYSWRHNLHSENREITKLSNGYTKYGHLSIGVWYFSLCVVQPEFSENGWFYDSFEEKCSMAANFYIRNIIFPRAFIDWVFNTALEPYGKSRLEVKILSTTGVVFAALGVIGTILYTRQKAKARYVGLLTFVSLSVSGGLYLSAVVKTLGSIPFHKLYFDDEYFRVTFYDVKFHCPWGLVLGIIGCILILTSAIGHLYILSRNKPEDDVQVYHINKGTDQRDVTQNTYTTIAPPGYYATVGLKEPPIDSEKDKEKPSTVQMSESYGQK